MNSLISLEKLDFKKRKNYYYIILNCSDNCEYVKDVALDYFEEGCVYTIGNDVIIVYPNQEILTEEFYDITQSLSLDLDIKIKYFKGSVINKSNYHDFGKIYKVYSMYTNKNYSYSTISELISYVLIKDSSLLKDIKKALISAILKDDQLINLVLALANNNLNVTKTAKTIYMHRNTINNKLEYIRNETGFDIQNFYDIVAVYGLIKYVE